MRSTTWTTLLFVFYCVEVGIFLTVAPWSSTWDRSVISLPLPSLHTLYLHRLFRGAISGFGLVHILWGAHDLERWLEKRHSARASQTEAGESS